MITPSLMDVLKENEKLPVESSDTMVSIENILGFVEHQDSKNIFNHLREKENLSQTQLASLDMAEIYLPALIRFKPGEIEEYLKKDVEDIRKNKMKRGL